MKKHYSVVQNMPGYLPDSPAVWFYTKKAAQDYAQYLADEWRDLDDDQTVEVIGTKRTGYDILDGEGVLQYVIEIYGPFYAPCDPDCDD